MRAEILESKVFATETRSSTPKIHPQSHIAIRLTFSSPQLVSKTQIIKPIIKLIMTRTHRRRLAAPYVTSCARSMVKDASQLRHVTSNVSHFHPTVNTSPCSLISALAPEVLVETVSDLEAVDLVFFALTSSQQYSLYSQYSPAKVSYRSFEVYCPDRGTFTAMEYCFVQR